MSENDHLKAKLDITKWEPTPSTSELEPCPFCGGEASQQNDDSEFYYVRCHVCKASTDIYSQAVRKPIDPKEMWNRRAKSKEAELAKEREKWEKLKQHLNLYDKRQPWVDEILESMAELEK